MKKYCMMLLCLLTCWILASGALARGSNQDIYEAQKKLTALGYAPGPADGIMGKKTQAAVEKFQKDRGVRPTGHLDNNTLNILLNLTIETSRATGQVNATVSQVLLTAQQLLQTLGYTPGPADGMMGKKTRAAIEKFQKDQNLPVTGTLNDTTLQQIKHMSNNRETPHEGQGTHFSGNQPDQSMPVPPHDKDKDPRQGGKPHGPGEQP